MNKYYKNKNAFTLAELIMALVVMSIILAAAATLAFALSSANDMADNSAEIQSRVRFATVRLSELIRNSKLICNCTTTEAVIWKNDGDDDGKIDSNEVVYVETGADNDCIRITEFSVNAACLSITQLGTAAAKTWLKNNCSPQTAVLINNCSYVSLDTNKIAAPYTKRLSVFFAVRQGGIVKNYQLTAALRCSADYLLNASGELVASDDDI